MVSGESTRGRTFVDLQYSMTQFFTECFILFLAATRPPVYDLQIRDDAISLKRIAAEGDYVVTFDRIKSEVKALQNRVAIIMVSSFSAKRKFGGHATLICYDSEEDKCYFYDPNACEGKTLTEYERQLKSRAALRGADIVSVTADLMYLNYSTGIKNDDGYTCRRGYCGPSGFCNTWSLFMAFLMFNNDAPATVEDLRAHLPENANEEKLASFMENFVLNITQAMLIDQGWTGHEPLDVTLAMLARRFDRHVDLFPMPAVLPCDSDRHVYRGTGGLCLAELYPVQTHFAKDRSKGCCQLTWIQVHNFLTLWNCAGKKPDLEYIDRIAAWYFSNAINPLKGFVEMADDGASLVYTKELEYAFENGVVDRWAIRATEVNVFVISDRLAVALKHDSAVFDTAVPKENVWNALSHAMGLRATSIVVDKDSDPYRETRAFFPKSIQFTGEYVRNISMTDRAVVLDLSGSSEYMPEVAFDIFADSGSQVEFFKVAFAHTLSRKPVSLTLVETPYWVYSAVWAGSPPESGGAETPDLLPDFAPRFVPFALKLLTARPTALRNYRAGDVLALRNEPALAFVLHSTHAGIMYVVVRPDAIEERLMIFLNAFPSFVRKNKQLPSWLEPAAASRESYAATFTGKVYSALRGWRNMA